MAILKQAESIRVFLWQHCRKEFLGSGEQLTKLHLLVFFKKREQNHSALSNSLKSADMSIIPYDK